MSNDAGTQMKHRLRTELGVAIKGGKKGEAGLIRELIAAIDNAEAAPNRAEQTSLVRHSFHAGSAEVERLLLSKDQVRDVLLREIEKRELAAAEFDRLGRADAAATLRADVVAAKRYIEDSA